MKWCVCSWRETGEQKEKQLTTGSHCLPPSCTCYSYPCPAPRSMSHRSIISVRLCLAPVVPFIHSSRRTASSFFLLLVLHIILVIWWFHLTCSSIKFVLIQLLLPGAQPWGIEMYKVPPSLRVYHCFTGGCLRQNCLNSKLVFGKEATLLSLPRKGLFCLGSCLEE